MCKIYNISDNPFARFSAEEEEDLRSILLYLESQNNQK